MKYFRKAVPGYLLGSMLFWACSGGGGSGNNNGSGGDGAGGDGASSAAGGDGSGAAPGNEGGAGALGDGGDPGQPGGAGGAPGSGGEPGTGGQPNNGGTQPNGGAGGRPNTGGTPNTGGAGTGGSAGQAMPAACVSPGCDNFETYTAGSRPGGSWNSFAVSGSGTLAVDTGKAYSGTKSVKFTANPGGGNAQMRFGAGHGTEVFMRAWMWLDKAVTGQGVFHWNFMRVEGGGTYIVSGGNASARTFTHGFFGARDCFAHGAMPIPVGKWTCVEFHVNGTTDLSETYYNGRVDEITQIVGGDPIPGAGGCLTQPSDNWAIPNADAVKFGISYAHEVNAPITLWMDDIVVSNKRVGCQ